MKTITGDLLQISSGVILHQVNCIGATGGLAGALRRKYPAAFEPYLKACSERMLGAYVVASVNSQLAIAHVFGQFQPGANTDLAAADIALRRLREEIQDRPAFAPYLMGCGLGGGDWTQYSALLEKHFPDITIVQLRQEFTLPAVPAGSHS